jgi:transcriptional regulator with XRE-family HTH domain
MNLLIRELRITRDIPLREVAKATGLSIATISNLERGKYQPSARTRHKIERWIVSILQSN